MSRDDLALRVDRVLRACGGGRVLCLGADADETVASFRSRAVLATAWPLAAPPPDTWRLPFPDRAFDMVCAASVLDGDAEDDGRDAARRAEAFAELLRLTRRGVLLVQAGRPRDAWERECLHGHPCRRHPLHQIVAPYEGLDWLRDPLEMLFEPLPADLRVGRALADLLPTRDLHMDMLREAGRRADAHVARYMMARQFVRPGDRVLDAASGLGYGSAILADGTLAASVLGVDLDPWAAAYASDHYGRHRRRLAFEACDVDALSERPAASFDTIVSFETLEHVADPDRWIALCRRLLTPAGRLVCSVPNRWVDDTGRDPNPHHVQVYDRERLERDCGRHFLIERVFGQTAGGGMKLPAAGRAIWPASGKPADAEWWLLVGMKDPAAPTDAAFRTGLVENPDDERVDVLAFARDYHNPWLARALVTLGLRATTPELLGQLADAVRDSADPASADHGAALCVTVYRCLEKGEPPDAALLAALRTYVGRAAEVPHVRRWQISLLYAEALVRISAGEWRPALEALEACASADALAFSPLIATKTVGAALLRGWLAVQLDDLEAARRWWTLGVRHAECALAGPWDALLVSREAPALFGMREATLIADLAGRCASGLGLLPHVVDRPGVAASQIFESFAGRAEHEARERRLLLDELDRSREWAGATGRELERVRAELVRRQSDVARLEGDVARLHGDVAWFQGEREWFVGERDRLQGEVGRLEAVVRQLTDERDELRARSLAERLRSADGSLPPHLRIAVFGAGSGGRLAVARLRARGGCVTCVADNDSGRHGQLLDGVPVVDPASLRARAIDAVVVASVPGRTAIVEQLERMGYRLGQDITPFDAAA